MIDVLYSSKCKINVIIIIMLKSKMLCDVVAQFPVSTGGTQPSSYDFTEYFMDHNVSRKEAIESFRLQSSDLLKKNVPFWCRPPCNSTKLKYCLGKEMLHDHCCCDSRHGKEQFPWLPHSCNVGQTCKPIIGSCITYTEIRECCCKVAIAKQFLFLQGD